MRVAAWAAGIRLVLSFAIMKTVTLILLAAGLAGVTGWQMKSREAARGERERVSRLEEELRRARAEQERLASAAADAGEWARLRAQAAEVHKLRGEVGGLRRELDEARRKLMAAPPKPGVPGEAVPAKKEVQVMVDARFLELDWEGKALQVPGMAAVLTAGNNGVVMKREQVEELMKELQTARGVDVLSAPRVVTRDGQEAVVQVGGTVTLPHPVTGAATEMPTGITMRVLPTLALDGATVRLEVGSQIVEVDSRANLQGATERFLRTNRLETVVEVARDHGVLIACPKAPVEVRREQRGPDEPGGITTVKTVFERIRILLLIPSVVRDGK